MAAIPATRIHSRTTLLSALKLRPGLGPTGLVLTLAAIVWVNSAFPKADWGWAWVVTLALVGIGTAIIGGSVNGRIEGVFIDERNLMSLSKFQMLIWTILVLSILVSAAAFNLQWANAAEADAAWRALGGNPAASPSWGPLDIAIPPELLFAMGIAAVSFVATPSLLSLKAADAPQAGSLTSTTQALGLAAGDTANSGKVFGKTEAGLARWGDMFRGDEVANAGAPDLGKIQQFMITLLVVGVYAAGAWSMFTALGDGRQAAVVRLPLLSSGLVTLMGISHASYLAYKAAPHGAADGNGLAATVAPPAADNEAG